MTYANQNFVTPFNEEFCTRLEYRISHELKNSDDQDLNGFWCDGLSWLPADSQLTQTHVNETKKIETKAWLGKTGQDVYKAVIHFGPKALKKYLQGEELLDCIPDLDSQLGWIDIDTENKELEIKLD